MAARGGSWAKGESKNYKGRPVGIKDKRLLYQSVREQLDLAGFNPVQAMIEIAREESHPVQTRRQATKDLLDKAYPDLKAIDISTQDSALEEMKKLKDEMKGLIIEHVKDY